MSLRPTWAEIDLDAIRFNYNTICRIISRHARLMAVVKANAYGHGIVEISKALEKENIAYLGVATVDEAVLLRKEGIRAPILVLGSVLKAEAAEAIKNRITLTLCNTKLLNILDELGRKLKIRPRVHIKVDTGMGRIGVWHEDALKFIKKVHRCRSVEIEGVYTHFTSAGRDRLFTEYQIKAFERLLNRIKAAGIEIKYRHAANSIAVVDWKKTHLNLVRPGIIIYGIYPKANFPGIIRLKPAFSLKTRIVFLKDVPPGRSISYGRTYITQDHTKIATLPIGYADGYGRILSNKAEVLVRGRRAPVVGKVTMDQTMLDVGHIKGVKIGDEVTLIGKQRSDEISIERLARHAGTIPYEIVTGITDRVPRKYK